MNVPQLIRAARRRAGMSQRQLAVAAGVPQATVGRIESGAVSPRAETVAALLCATGHELAVMPRLGIGVDRSLIRDRLRLTPAERIQRAVEEGRGMPGIRMRR